MKTILIIFMTVALSFSFVVINQGPNSAANPSSSNTTVDSSLDINSSSECIELARKKPGRTTWGKKESTIVS